MGFRYHRSIKIIPGLRLNLSKSGVGISTGVKGYHIAHMANGRTRRTVSIPGTGMSWIDQSSGNPPARTPTRSAPTTPASPPQSTAPAHGTLTPTKPGWLDDHSVKALYDAVQSDDIQTMLQLSQTPSTVTLAAGTLAGVHLLQAGRDDEALTVLQHVFDTGVDPGSDPFIVKYLTMSVTVELVEGASCSLPIDRTTVGLLLAELYQRQDQTKTAIAIVEQLTPSATTALALADFYDLTGAFSEVLTLTEGAPNADDASSLLWIFRGIAFRELGQHDAARECFAKVIRCRTRNPIVLHRARFERAKSYVAQGKTALARKDLAVIQSEDSSYEGLAEAIASLGS